jgi:hypothetical protein
MELTYVKGEKVRVRFRKAEWLEAVKANGEPGRVKSRVPSNQMLSYSRYDAFCNRGQIQQFRNRRYVFSL